MKTPEEKANEFAVANEEYPSFKNELETVKANCFLAGYKDCQKEYEEKLRWIPVEEFEFKIKSPENPDIIIFKEDNRYSVLEITDLYSINYAKNNYSHCRYFL